MALAFWRKKSDYISVQAYNSYLDQCLARHGDDPDLAFAKALGSPSLELFCGQCDL